MQLPRLKIIDQAWVADNINDKRKVNRSGSLSVVFNKTGARFNVFATRNMNLAATDSLYLAFDESYPTDLYLVKKEGGFKPALNKKSEGFIRKSVFIKIIQSVLKQKDLSLIKLEINSEPIIVNKLECWVLNTRKPLLVKYNTIDHLQMAMA